MTLIARKQSSAKQERLRRFVAEHVDALEPGMRIIEAGLRLGRMAVDLVAADARQTLVLIGVTGVATDRMLVGMLDAYIWCLQFPDGLRRLCPDAPITFTRPPRLVIVAQEVPEAFMELVGCLSLEVECHELAAEASPEAAVAEARVGLLAGDALAPGSRAVAPATAPMPASASVPVAAPAPAASVPAAAPTPATVTATPVTQAAAPAAAPAPATDAPVPSPATAGSAPTRAEDDEPVEERSTEILAAAAHPDAENRPDVEPEPPMPEPNPADILSVPAPAGGTNGTGPASGPMTPLSPFSRNGRRLPSAGGVAAGLRSAAGNGTHPPAGRDANGARPGGRGYAFAQAARQPQPGPAPATEPPVAKAATPATGESATTGPETTAPEAPPAEAAPESRPPRRPSVDGLPFSSSGVSRQWQEFLARLASAQ
jgi:hypothetical protein